MDIRDNFLDLTSFAEIKTTLLGNNFPWFFQNTVVGYNDRDLQETNLDQYQFTHVFYMDSAPRSEGFYLLKPLLDKLNISALVRVKANLTPRTLTRHIHGYHSDYPEHKNMKTAVFYVNTNDGATVFKDGSEVSSIENRLVEFDTPILHSGTTSTDTPVRCVINLNYYTFETGKDFIK